MPFLAFFLSPIGRWVAIVAVAAVAIGGSFLYFKTHYYNQGWNAHAAKIQQEIQERRNNADEGSNARRDCINAGRVWEITEGKCVGD